MSGLIVALDFADLGPCRELLRKLKGLVKIYKIGSELFTAHGWKAVELVQESGAKVFLDLKLHDIPTTAARTSRVITKRGVFMFNIHALGGFEMMEEVRKAVEEAARGRRKPLLLAVTILTSHDRKTLARELGIRRPLQTEVLALARLAKKAGLDGVISSPEEIPLLRRELGKEFVLVTPGIRPVGADAQDQRRSLTPAEALRGGADYLVVGRPVTQAKDPRSVVRGITASFRSFRDGSS